MHAENDKEGTSSSSSFEEITPDEVSDVRRADFPKQKTWKPKRDIFGALGMASSEDAQKPLLYANVSKGNNVFFMRIKSSFVNNKLYSQIPKILICTLSSKFHCEYSGQLCFLLFIREQKMTKKKLLRCQVLTKLPLKRCGRVKVLAT